MTWLCDALPLQLVFKLRKVAISSRGNKPHTIIAICRVVCKRFHPQFGFRPITFSRDAVEKRPFIPLACNQTGVEIESDNNDTITGFNSLFANRGDLQNPYSTSSRKPSRHAYRNAGGMICILFEGAFLPVGKNRRRVLPFHTIPMPAKRERHSNIHLQDQREHPLSPNLCIPDAAH